MNATPSQFNQVNLNNHNPIDTGNPLILNLDPQPLSYVLIDHDTTKALNESAQAHAASRQTQKWSTKFKLLESIKSTSKKFLFYSKPV